MRRVHQVTAIKLMALNWTALRATALAMAGLTLLATRAEVAQPAVAPVSLSGQSFVVEGDAIPVSLTGQPGDPARGRAIVADRQKGLCLLCHDGPIQEQRFRGTLAPGLAGAGARLTPGQLRLRLVDGKRLNPDTIMPSYGVPSAAARVAPAFRGRPLLGPAEIEDVVAYLSTLQDPEATESP